MPKRKYPSKLDRTCRALESKGPVTYTNSKVKFNEKEKAVCGNCGKVFKSNAEERLLAAIYNSDLFCPECTKLEGFGKIGCTSCRKAIPTDKTVFIGNMPFHSACAADKYLK
jgi:hypothetical protein